MIAFARQGEVRPPRRERSAPDRARAKIAPAPRERAHQQGRGRRASSPWAIPWRGWKEILWRTYEKINDNRLMAVAAGVVFYSLLALFPAITALVSLYGLFADASTIDSLVSKFSGILPGGAVDILHEELKRLAAHKGANGAGFIVGLFIALWSANAGTKAIIDALNVVYGEKEKRSFLRLNLVSPPDADRHRGTDDRDWRGGGCADRPGAARPRRYRGHAYLDPAMAGATRAGHHWARSVLYRDLPCRARAALAVDHARQRLRRSGVACQFPAVLLYIANFGNYNAPMDRSVR